METGTELGMRGREFVGTVINAKMHKTATVEWPRKVNVPKYDRQLMKRTRVKVHNPESINAKVGDRVRIKECRPLSKTKKFIIVEKLGVDFDYVTREEDLKAGMHREEELEEKE